MEQILLDFESLAKDIAAIEQLQLLSYHLAPPAPASVVARFQEQLGIEFPKDLLAYYSLCNGIQLRWIRKNSAYFSVEEFGKFQYGSVPFSDIIDDSGRIEGSINVLPIQESFGNREKYFEKELLHANKQVRLNGEVLGFDEFEGKVFPFDAFHPNLNAGILVDKEPVILNGLGTVHFFSLSSTVTEYFEVVLKNKGFILSRQMNYHHSYAGEYRMRTVDTGEKIKEIKTLTVDKMILE